MFRSSRSKTLAVAAALLMALFVAAGVYAQGGPRGRGPRPGGPGFGPGFGPGLPIGQLDLSDAQKTLLREVMQRYRSEMRDAGQKLRDARKAQHDAVQTVPLNEGLVSSTSDALAAAETAMAVVQARIHSDVYGILTDEQRVKAKQVESQREERAKQLQQRFQNRQQRRPQ